MSERLTQLNYDALPPAVRPLADDILEVSSAGLGGPYNALLRSPDMARRCFELLARDMAMPPRSCLQGARFGAGIHLQTQASLPLDE